jgi:Mlc titration factor MtfA (ptsG expression regulator)
VVVVGAGAFGGWTALYLRELGHRVTLIDQYGATNPAEFFAVISEAFFTDSAVLARDHDALYEQLARFYRQDPAGRLDP